MTMTVTIARQLGVHRDTVLLAIEVEQLEQFATARDAHLRHDRFARLRRQR